MMPVVTALLSPLCATARPRAAAGPTFHGVLVLLMLLFGIPALAASASPVETAIRTSDPGALRQALRDYFPPPSGADDAPLLLAIDVLSHAPPKDKERAREVIRVLVAAGAPLNQPFKTPLGETIGTPVTWIGRIAGEREFLLEIMSHVAPDRRCDLIADMIDDGNPGQWDNALASIALVAPNLRGSDRCADLFTRATRAADADLIAARAEALFSAGLSPNADAAADVITRLSNSVAARRVIVRILAFGDLDRPLVRPVEFADGTRLKSVFAVLLHSALMRSGDALQADLAAMPEWPRLLENHQTDAAACDGAILRAANESWDETNLDGTVTDIASPKRGLLRAGTQWLLSRCDPSLIKAQSAWAQMVKAGSGDLVALAIDRGVDLEDRASLTNVAICAGDDRLFERLMRDVAIKPSLDVFLACLPPPELPVKDGGDIRILRWLLAHRADPSSPIDDAQPRAIAALFDRNDVVTALEQAGAKPARLTGDLRQTWLRRRLDRIAGFDPPSLSFEATTDGEEDRDPAGGGLVPVDIDGDGRPEFITADGYCGNVNCQFAVAAYRDRQWRIVLSDAGDTQLLATKHRGWRDISVSGRASAAEFDTTIYHYDGSSYRAAICERTIYRENNDTPRTTRRAC